MVLSQWKANLTQGGWGRIGGGGGGDGHFAWEKLARPDWTIRLRSRWSDLNYTRLPWRGGFVCVCASAAVDRHLHKLLFTVTPTHEVWYSVCTCTCTCTGGWFPTQLKTFHLKAYNHSVRSILCFFPDSDKLLLFKWHKHVLLAAFLPSTVIFKTFNFLVLSLDNCRQSSFRRTNTRIRYDPA